MLEVFKNILKIWAYSRLEFKKRKKDSKTFVRIPFANNIYLKKI